MESLRNKMLENKEHKTAAKICAATIGIEANSKDILPNFSGKIEVKSLLTDFYSVEEIPFSDTLDGLISIEVADVPPACTLSQGTFEISGPLLKLAEEASDLRFSLWGNQGLLYRYTLHLLEKKHHIHNFHACALYDNKQDTLYVVIGGAGSGKTIYLLSGLSQGLQLFSTETVHFQITGKDIIWHIGSLVDNIRLGTLLYDFPDFLPDIPSPSPDTVWKEKIALDLSKFKASRNTIKNPRAVYLLFPRIEREWKGFTLDEIDNNEKASSLLFENITQKLSETFILYDKITVKGFEQQELSIRRLSAVNRLLESPQIKKIATVLANPQNCWSSILE